MSPTHPPRSASARARGFSLLEIMIALTLGLLLSIGIISLFSNTSQMNRVQNGLARLQENGRFAVTRIEQDLRMFSAQYCSNTVGRRSGSGPTLMLAARAPMVYAADLGWPDSGFASIDANGNPTADAAGAAYPLSPRWFVQGYSCSGNACTPALPSGIGQIPEAGMAPGRRVPGSDVLTMRYQRGTGWTIPVGSCSVGPAQDLGAGTSFTVAHQEGDDPIADLKPGLALISDCVSPAIIPIADATDGTVVVGDILGAGENVRATGALCSGNRTRDVRLFNFSADFVTVSYYLAFRADDNPDARPNSAAPERLIPVLIRREGGVEQELVRGVDQLAFRYGVQEADGNTRFLDAEGVETLAGCSQPPDGTAMEPGCAWRDLRSIEAHLLVNSVDEVFGLDAATRTWRFNGEEFSPESTATLPSGLNVGSMPRREFVAYVTGRNRNF